MSQIAFYLSQSAAVIGREMIYFWSHKTFDMKLNPYLNFDGNAEEAFKFYQSVFGGELFLQRMNQAPGTESLPAEEKNRVMHVSIPIGDGQFLMASDTVPSMGHQLHVGNNNYISITPDSRKEADRLFNGLSAGGKVEMPMADMFWGDYFGSFEDKFGVRWMINFSNKENNKDVKQELKAEAVH
jgi:PhnB protein